ncbi:AraC family transcriptional regulator [Bacillus sp. 7520-S]|nr:AraC family transcriptional regulator [Bacillus sp. 7520-S]
MNTEEMKNILQTLTNLEEFYKEHMGDKLKSNEHSTYRNFLNNSYIKENNLVGVYWPQLSGKAPEFITYYKELDEDLLILKDLNIALSKHINFSLNLMHSNKYFQCIYIYEGSGVLNLEKQRLNLVEGDFLIMPPDVNHSITMSRGSICIYIMIRQKYISSVFLDLFNHNLHLTGFFNNVLSSNQTANHYILFHTGVNPDIQRTILLLYIEYLWGDELRNNIIECYLQLLFSFLLRYDIANIESSVSFSSTELHYNKILNYITNNFRSATLTSTADHVYLSKQYICRIIKQMTGSNFSTILMDIKLSKVKVYLIESNLNLETIAEHTGFSDVSHMSRAFKGKIGTTPSKYRLQNKE